MIRSIKSSAILISIIACTVIALANMSRRIDCFELSTRKVEALAEKLDNHYEGKDLDSKITFIECREALDEFMSSDEDLHDTRVVNAAHSGAVNYLDDFVHKYLRGRPFVVMECEFKNETGEAFVEQLEEHYKRLKSNYDMKISLRESRLADKSLVLVDSLMGFGPRVTFDIFEEGKTEIEQNLDSLVDIVENGDVYWQIEEFEELHRFCNTPEVYAFAVKIFPLLSEDYVDFQLEDDSVVEELMSKFKKELSSFKIDVI